MKAERFADKWSFIETIGRAVVDYDRSRGNAEWSPKELKRIAKSAANAVGLECGKRRVDDSIAHAICAMAEDRPYEENLKKAEAAWEAYRMHLRA